MTSPATCLLPASVGQAHGAGRERRGGAVDGLGHLGPVAEERVGVTHPPVQHEGHADEQQPHAEYQRRTEALGHVDVPSEQVEAEMDELEKMADARASALETEVASLRDEVKTLKTLIGQG